MLSLKAAVDTGPFLADESPSDDDLSGVADELSGVADESPDKPFLGESPALQDTLQCSEKPVFVLDELPLPSMPRERTEDDLEPDSSQDEDPAPSEASEAPVWLADSTDSKAVDIIDREIRKLCNRWPALTEDHSIFRVAHGRYRINGRRVTVQIVIPEEKDAEADRADSISTTDCSDVVDPWCGGPGVWVDSDAILVRDGERQRVQPFLDYVFDTGRRETYMAGCGRASQQETTGGTGCSGGGAKPAAEDEMPEPEDPDDQVAQMQYAMWLATRSAKPLPQRL